jgi:hypothetical protein
MRRGAWLLGLALLGAPQPGEAQRLHEAPPGLSGGWQGGTGGGAPPGWNPGWTPGRPPLQGAAPLIMVPPEALMPQPEMVGPAPPSPSQPMFTDGWTRNGFGASR